MGMAHTVFTPSRGAHLPLEDQTFAEAVKPLGYLTGMAGKWQVLYFLSLANLVNDTMCFYISGYMYLCLCLCLCVRVCLAI